MALINLLGNRLGIIKRGPAVAFSQAGVTPSVASVPPKATQPIPGPIPGMGTAIGNRPVTPTINVSLKPSEYLPMAGASGSGSSTDANDDVPAASIEVYHWPEGGPCPVGMIDRRELWLMRDNPLNPTPDEMHIWVDCVYPGDGFGGGSSGGGTLGRGFYDPYSGGGRGFNGFGGSILGSGLNNPPDSSLWGPYKHLPHYILDKAAEILESMPSTYNDCSGQENGGPVDRWSDPEYPKREYGGCTKGEIVDIVIQLSLLLANPFLKRYPGLARCLEEEFAKLHWCCHTTFNEYSGPSPKDFNYNLTTDDLLVDYDPKLQATIQRAKETGTVRLGTWFLKPGNDAMKQWFLLRLLGELCPVHGSEIFPMSYIDALLLLGRDTKAMVCDYLLDYKRRHPKAWAAILDQCKLDNQTNYSNGKYFAIELCTGNIYIRPLEPGMNPNTLLPAIDENGEYMGLGHNWTESRGFLWNEGPSIDCPDLY